MKKGILLKSMLLLFALIVGSSSVWGQDKETIASFNATDYNAGNTNNWDVSNADYATSSKGNYYKLISSDASISTPSINWSEYEDITITITARKFGGPNATQGKISVSQGTSELNNFSPNSTDPVSSGALSISPTGTGRLTIACLGASSSKGCGVYSIEIKGTPSSGTPDPAVATTVTIDDSDITNTDVYTSTAAGSLSATVTVTEGGAAVSGAIVTWSSSNTGVATIDASTGAVTLVAKGKTTITASYAGVTNQYKPSSATYELTVTSSAPDYATLPFEYDGNGTNLPVGLTANGLGTYSSSPAMKFDGTGDYLILKINEAPGKLTYDILGNGFSGGTFKVQVSADGETYTDLKTYTSIGSNKQSEELTPTSSTRYIKWIYTNKSSGNVALGNIKLALPTSTPSISASDLDIAYNTTNGTISYTINNSVDGGELTAALTAASDWFTLGSVTSSTVAFTASENDGDARSATVRLTYTYNTSETVTKDVTVTQAKLPFTITDGVFDFTQDEDYGSGLEKSGVKVQTSTWTAGNVTMVMTGRNCWYNAGNEIRLYKASGDDAAGSITLSVPTGSVITDIAFTGASLNKMSAGEGTYTKASDNKSASWTGSSNSITFTASDRTDIYTITVTYLPLQTINLNAACNDGNGNIFGTYSSENAFVVPAGLTVSAVSVSGGKLVVTDYEIGDIVAANTGVMVSATSAGNKTVAPSGEEATVISGNMLKASGDAGITAADMATADSGCIFYRLTMHNGEILGFWWGAEDGAAFALAANKAYLAVPEAEASAIGFEFDDETTGIVNLNRETITNNQYYTLDGRRVENPTKGLYIVNGRKVIVK